MTASAALWFLPFAGPISVWVAWSDMKTMRIPNNAVIALFAVFALVGLLALPFEEYLWRWPHLLVVLAIGFLLNLTGMIGAGDAKFAAVMAPFIARPDIMWFLMLFSAVLVAAYGLHRGARSLPVLRRATPGWESWERKDFPMGLALGGGLLAYLLVKVFNGA